MVAGARGRNLFLPGMIALVVFLAVGIYWYVREDFSSLPDYGEIPEFSLIRADGGTVTRQSLMGSVWVVDTIYTRCTETCPLQTATLVKIQREFRAAGDLRLLSISVDPAYDKPSVLKSYADRYGADRGRWYFLTGKKREIEKLVTNGLHLPFIKPQNSLVGWAAPVFRLAGGLFSPSVAYAHHGPHESPDSRRSIVHSARFVLLDRQARIRGYYHSDKLDSIEKLKKDLRIILNL